MKRPQAFGSLNDNVSALATRVCIGTFDAPIIVWADDRGQVFGARVSRTLKVPATWIAGTFDSGSQHADIEEDLRMLQCERARDWISD